jgi:hypothetical protein
VLNNKVLFTPSVFTTDDFNVAVHEKGGRRDGQHAEGGGENRQVKAGKSFTKRFTEETFQNPKIKTSYPARADCVPSSDVF